MSEAVEGGRGRWSTAVGLTFAVLAFSVFDPLSLVALPFAVLLVALPPKGKWIWVGAGALILVIGVVIVAGALPLVSRGWAMMIGSLFLGLSLGRPNWGVAARAMASVAIAATSALLVLIVTGRVAELDGAVREQLRTALSVVLQDLQRQAADPEQFGQLVTTMEQVTGDLFPALLALQSVAALALAAWWVRRIGRTESGAFELAPLREFRFSDELIWILIVGVVLMLLPLGESVGRVALNLLVFMGALYALRGLAVFVFLATGSKSVLTIVLGLMALVFLYPVALTAALLMGVGDTWLDVRRRVAAAAQT